MQSTPFTPRQARVHYRHELRTLTYVTLDEANGGIVRNLNREGVAVQAVGRLHPEQRVRLRFELRFPRLCVETRGEVSWAGPTGQCGIRFVDLPAKIRHEIDAWIFSNLLDAIARDAARPSAIFGSSGVSNGRKENVPEEDSGLTLSAASRPAIPLEQDFGRRDDAAVALGQWEDSCQEERLNWLSRPLSGRTLAWVVDSLAVVAGVLLFAVIFLSIAHELPPWPVALGAAAVAAVFVAAAYRIVFAVFGGRSLGACLSRGAARIEKPEGSGEAMRIR